MTPGVEGSQFWLISAAVCMAIVLVNLVWGLRTRLKSNPPHDLKLKIKIGQRTLLFDPDEPSERFEKQLAEALDEPRDDGPSSR